MERRQESAEFLYDDEGTLVAFYKANGTLKLYYAREAGIQDIPEIFDAKRVLEAKLEDA